MGKINRLMVLNGTVKVKNSGISAPISIPHADDFTKYFPVIFFSQNKRFLKIMNSLIVLKNSFNCSHYIITLNLVPLLLKPERQFPIDDFLACLTITHSS